MSKLLIAAIAVSLATVGVVAAAATRDGGGKTQPATANARTTSGAIAASCVAAVEWNDTTYYGMRGPGEPLSLEGPLGDGTIPNCQDVAPGSPSPGRSVALARVTGLPPEMAVALADDRNVLYVAPRFFPQIPGTRLHEAVYGPDSNVPNERKGAEGCPVSTTADIAGRIVSSSLGGLRVDASNPDAELPGKNPIFTDARTKIARTGATIPFAEAGDSVRAWVLVCRNAHDPHFLKLVATRVEIEPG